ncbi:MAG TPA: SRPBCC family protein [Candidatus Saccharimonadia bacterium]|nr:SRPBCC family protein [Candidatus Saccharimonadia bacterium]
MTVSVVSRISVEAKPRAIFKYLADSSYHFLWNPHLHSLEPANKLKLGSKYKTSSVLLGVRVSGKNAVTGFVADKELQIENVAGTISYIVNYKLHPQGEDTQVVCTTEVTADGNAFAFTKPLLRLLARRELQSDLKALKIAVENKLS